MNTIELSNAYIVHTDHLLKPPHFATLDHWYNSMVASLSSETNSARVFYVYDTALHGFAAELTGDQARRLSNTPGVAGVFKDRAARLDTTRSPGFLGLDKDFGIWPDTNFGDGVVIGFVDTGIWPESASFSDAGLGLVRPSWKGRCVDGERFNASMCNNKLVGARFFTAGMVEDAAAEFQSPRDKDGHGTHVASTAAGAEVAGAGLFGFARGTARGVAPRARVAMYKACVHGYPECTMSSIVAAIDAAVEDAEDGVDILSLSLGGYHDTFHEHPMSIALFGAVRAGIFVACSAGNLGRDEFALRNLAPWITTVGAGTVDRVLPVSVTLGDGQVLTGQSLYAQTSDQTDMIRLLPSNCYDDDDLVPDRIMGKIVVCTDGASASKGIRPQLALDPGLVYDAVEKDYVAFLCTLNYTASQVRLFVPGFAGCTRTLHGGAAGLNYPSFVVAFDDGGAGVRVLTRTVTKVSRGPEAYTARVVAPDQVTVLVDPETLEFGGEPNEKKSYKVAFRSNRNSPGKTTQFGHIVWENDVHRVRTQEPHRVHLEGGT
ncbi:hypothetical protein ACP4OV_018980 [Aristida adscensionis]